MQYDLASYEADRYIKTYELPNKINLSQHEDYQIFRGYFIRRLLRQRRYNKSAFIHEPRAQILGLVTKWHERTLNEIDGALAYVEDQQREPREIYGNTFGFERLRAIELSVNDLVTHGSKEVGKHREETFNPETVLNSWITRWGSQF